MQEDGILISTLIISAISLGHLLGILIFLTIDAIHDKIKSRKGK